MNSLSGRFGMAPINEENIIIPSKDFEKFSQENTLTDIKDYEDNCLVKYISNEKKKNHNINVSISAAITS